MQPRLRRSATGSVVAGVCGGLAEYFNIDPVIVRLIFVVVTLTSGLGLPAYLILWVVMPGAQPGGTQPPSGRRARRIGRVTEETGQPVPTYFACVDRQEPLEQSGQAAYGSAVDVQEASGKGGEPFTAQPRATEGPAGHGAEPVVQTPAAPARGARRGRTLGLILIGIGGLVMLDQFGIDTSFLFPALLIVAGAILLQRQR
ncbi:MAG: PspC domain-containing protein [Chloroflexaceae bacterium]